MSPLGETRLFFASQVWLRVRGEVQSAMPFAGFDHIDLRVADLAAARPLYDALLPALGLTQLVVSADACEYYEPAEPDEARRFFGLTAAADHYPNATRICFAATSAADVDRLAEIARVAGARAIEGPEIPYSSEKYYAVFFEDTSGNRLEIAYRRPHHAAAAELIVEPPETLEA